LSVTGFSKKFNRFSKKETVSPPQREIIENNPLIGIKKILLNL
jgi:hypothetical protein